MKSFCIHVCLLTLLLGCTLSRKNREPFRQFMGEIRTKKRLWLAYNDNGQSGHGKGDALYTTSFGQRLIAILPVGSSITFTKAYETWDIGGGGGWLEGYTMVKGQMHPVQFELDYDADYGGYNPAQMSAVFQRAAVP